MNLEELKSAWQAYDLKLQTSQLLTEKLIVGMIRDRSKSRVSQIRKENKFFFILLIFELLVLGAVFTGNPFDFTHTMQFVPFALLAVGILMALWTVYKSQMILETDMNDTTLGAFLKKVIREYEKNKRFEGWFGIIMLASGCLTVLSFLPKKLEKMSLQSALLDTAIPIAICLSVYFMAFKLGAFKNAKSAGFKEDLQELEALSAELELTA